MGLSLRSTPMVSISHEWKHLKTCGVLPEIGIGHGNLELSTIARHGELRAMSSYLGIFGMLHKVFIDIINLHICLRRWIGNRPE